MLYAGLAFLLFWALQVVFHIELLMAALVTGVLFVIASLVLRHNERA